MNKKYVVIFSAALVVLLGLGIFSWLLPRKGDAEELKDKYTIEITNCSKITFDNQGTDRALKDLFKSTDYVTADSGHSFLTPIVRVADANGKKISFGIPIYGINYWRYKWANPYLYLYADRIEDQDLFWNHPSDENFEKIKTILTKDNVVVKISSSYTDTIDLAQSVERNNHSFNSITSFKQALDKRIRNGEIKTGDVLSVFVKCYKLIRDTIPQPQVADTVKVASRIESKSSRKIILTGLSRIPKENKITWSDNLAQNADKLVIEFLIDGQVFKSEDVTHTTKYVYNPGVKGAGVYTEVVLDAKFDKTKYALMGATRIEKQLFTCSAK